MPPNVLDKEQQNQQQPFYERRYNSVDKSMMHEAFSDHFHNCPNTHGQRELAKEIQELWKKVTLIEVLDHRVSAVEDALDTIVANISTTMVDIHKIQTSIAETNVLRMWVGRVIVGVLSAVVTFLSAKYA